MVSGKSSAMVLMIELPVVGRLPCDDDEGHGWSGALSLHALMRSKRSLLL